MLLNLLNNAFCILDRSEGKEGLGLGIVLGMGELELGLGLGLGIRLRLWVMGRVGLNLVVFGIRFGLLLLPMWCRHVIFNLIA